MIKFFRRIRHKLLGEGKVKNYLLYAIGEIVLVVVGILIALQLNNFNEAKKEKLKEYKILTSLLEDFTTNQKEISQSIDELNMHIERYMTQLTYIGYSENQISKDVIEMLNTTQYIVTDLVDGTLNSILNSDKLEIIKNDSLKNMLTRFPAFIKRYNDEEDRIENYVINV